MYKRSTHGGGVYELVYKGRDRKAARRRRTEKNGIARFSTMSGEEFFLIVYTHLSPEESWKEEYLEENPSERKIYEAI